MFVDVRLGSSAFIMFFGRDSWVLLEKIQVKPESLLYMSAPPRYVFHDHTHATPPDPAWEGARVLQSFPVEVLAMVISYLNMIMYAHILLGGFSL